MAGNPLVAQARSQTTGVTGIGVLESANDLANGVKDGSWVEAGLGGLGVGLEALALVTDPIGTLAQYGVSWLIEHVKPLKDCLDWLAGNPPVIQSFSDTWANVAEEVNAITGDLANEAKNGTAGWEGAGADAYRGEVAEQTDALAGAASLCDGISTGVMIMGQVVAAVRETVRDLIATLVGKLISWALEEACTLGFATPAVAVQATTAITNTINKVSTLIRKLIKTISNVGPKVRKIVDKLGEIIEKLSKLAKRLGKPGEHTTPSAARKAGHAADDVHAPKDHTTPAGMHETPDGTTPSHTPDAGTKPSGADDHAPSRPNDEAASKTPEDGRTTCNDPVDVVSGEVVLAQTDVELHAQLPLVLTRTHVSSYRAGRSFGRSWASTVDQRLEFDATGVVFVAEDGMLLTYPHPADDGSAVLPRLGPRWPLARVQDGFEVRQPDRRRVLHFPAGGAEAPIGGISDHNGTRLSFLRDADGGLEAVTHPAGYRVDVRRAGGRVIELRLAVAEPITLVRYHYDDAGTLAEVVNSSGRPITFSYDPDGRITRWADRNGQWYSYLYDAQGRCVANVGAGGFLNGTFSYDRTARETRFTDALGHTTTYVCNELNQVVREIDPLGNATTREWDRFDRLLAETDPLGRTTRREYDAAGHLVAIVRPDGKGEFAEYDERGLPVVVTDPDGAVWRQAYDERGNLVVQIDPAGAETRYEHDAAGGPIRVVDALGGVHRIENGPSGLPVAITDPVGATTRYTRDAFGRVVSIADPAGGVTGLGWTVEGKQAWLRQPDGATQRWLYDGEGNETRYVDAAGGVTVKEHTHLDLLAAQTEPDGARTEFTYDANLQLVAVRNPGGHSWLFEYDAAGNLAAETDFNGRRTEYRYDAAGRLVARVNAVGQTTRFERDVLGNVVRRLADDGTEASFAFDAAGRLVRAVNGDGDLVLERDALGRITREAVNGRAVESVFDLMGRRVLRRTASGAESVARYDAAGRQVELRAGERTLSFGYDVAGRQTERVLDSGVVVSFAWDVNHRVIGQTVSVVSKGAARANVLQRRSYRYRADGAVLAGTDQLRGARGFELDAVSRVKAVAGPSWSETYAYDRTGNVVAAAWPAGDTAAQGERAYRGTIVERAGNLVYRHDAQGRLVGVRRKLLSRKDENWQFSWNAEDRLVGVVTPDGTRWRYRYDALGRRTAKERLAAGSDEVAERTIFGWDGGNLVEQETAGGTTTWEWDVEGEQPLAQRERIRADDQGWVDDRFYSIVTDLVGTPTELVGSTGELAWVSRTNIWGRQVTESPDGVDMPLRLPGQYHDRETGLHYNVQRYYDPRAARFVSPDPLGLPGGVNPHGYVPNPITWLDPLGLQGKSCWENASRADRSTEAGRLTAPQQRDMAKFCGLQEVKAKMKGQPVFTDGKRFYTYDIDGHNGGLWKVADDVRSLGSKKTRSGTWGLGRPGGSREPWQLYRVGD
ncbi:RHS repeat-associated core domain-containing protein [Amycolatopsis sp. NPDC004169]|uniref:RHS repeat-associated core domain-containing protein n=1 Tax=Amycolatopsis sp. NPDC004169 TaxID=3154453 RepID=UPI0033A936B8